MLAKIYSFKRNKNLHKGLLWFLSGLFFQNNIPMFSESKSSEIKDLSISKYFKFDKKSFSEIQRMNLNPSSQVKITPSIYGEKGTTYEKESPYLFLMVEDLLQWNSVIKSFIDKAVSTVFFTGDFESMILAQKIERTFMELSPIIFASKYGLDFIALILKSFFPEMYNFVLEKGSLLGAYIPIEMWSTKIFSMLFLQEMDLILLDYFLSKAKPGYKSYINDLNKINDSIKSIFQISSKAKFSLESIKNDLIKIKELKMQKEEIFQNIILSLTEYQKISDQNIEKIKNDFNSGSHAFVARSFFVQSNQVDEIKNELSKISLDKKENTEEQTTLIEEENLLEKKQKENLSAIFKTMKEFNADFFVNFVLIKPELDKILKKGGFASTKFEEYEIFVINDIVVLFEKQEKILKEENVVVFVISNYTKLEKLGTDFVEEFIIQKTLQKVYNINKVLEKLLINSTVSVPGLIIETQGLKIKQSEGQTPTFSLQTKNSEYTLEEVYKNRVEVTKLLYSYASLLSQNFLQNNPENQGFVSE